MGFYRGPNIVTDGLVFAVDAGSERSYPGSGTTVSNIINGASGTLTNGVGFNSSNGGSFTLDGTDDYINFGNQSLISGDFCIDLWYKLTQTKSEHYIFSTGYNSAGSILIFTSGIWLNAADTNGRMPGPGGTINEIINITVERTGGVAKWYKNGVYQSSLSYSGAIASSTTYTAGWAIPRNNGSAYMAGNLYSIKMYNKGFSSAEVTQNYNAQKSRFGL